MSDLIILGLIMATVLFYNIGNRWRRRRVSLRIAAARKAVQKAVEILAEQGFKIIDVEKAVHVTTGIDGRLYRYTVTADVICKKRGKTYLVEVRSGKKGSRVTSVRAQRELLGHYLLFGPAGIIILDVDSDKMREIRIAVDGTAARWRRVAASLGYMLIGALLLWVTINILRFRWGI
ncbi:MAG: hypothetical protein H0Z35_03450 [Thermoanaerobacteraceae bacterium]|nr:hypothetical protein [Thermoanaerobacteraceae bacterium]